MKKNTFTNAFLEHEHRNSRRRLANRLGISEADLAAFLKENPLHETIELTEEDLKAADELPSDDEIEAMYAKSPAFHEAQKRMKRFLKNWKMMRKLDHFLGLDSE